MVNDFRKCGPFSLNISGELLDADRARELALVEVELHEDKLIAELHYMVGVYAKGRDYTNVIMVAGYVALLTLWSGVAKDIAPVWRLSSGGLIAISLLAFLTWEVVKMVHLMNEGHVIGGALASKGSRSDFAREIQWARDKLAMEEARLHDLWPAPFYIALISGLTGAALLAIACLSKGLYLAIN